MEKVCQYCKETFAAKRIDSVYCSRSCRQMAYMDRKMKLNQMTTSFPLVNTHIETRDNNNDDKSAIYETTIDGSGIKDSSVDGSLGNKKPSIDGFSSDKIVEEKQVEQKYDYVYSQFLERITEIINYGSNTTILNNCITNEQDIPTYWIGLRLRCLVECLLLFSEMKYTSVADLMEVCNAFTTVTRSSYYTLLPEEFPYISIMINLKEKLKKVCIKAHKIEKIKFRLTQEDKIELMAVRFELSQFIPKKQFNELLFESEKRE
ncbi:MAG: hypothetical protein H0U95_02120 [Bacteroidetes bacterium]|nr:hypothetical protein [Bacteroidota bacterium]